MYKPFFLCVFVCMCVKFIYILSIYKQVDRELHTYTTVRKCMLWETTVDFFLVAWYQTSNIRAISPYTQERENMQAKSQVCTEACEKSYIIWAINGILRVNEENNSSNSLSSHLCMSMIKVILYTDRYPGNT